LSLLPDLLDQISEGEDIGTVTGDSACDARRCHSAIITRGATAIIPIRKNGQPCNEDRPAAQARNETLRAIRHRWPPVLDAVDTMPRPQPRRNQDALPQGLRRTHRRERSRTLDRRHSHPHRPHEPLQRPRHN
jgi:hypothetical protein